VTDPDCAAERLTLKPRFKRTQLAFGAPAAKHAVIKRSNAGGVIAAVLEALERVDELAGNRLSSENSDDPAHPLGWPLCPSLIV
jgi:hypothetical protein